MPDVCSTSFYCLFLNYVLKLNTFWNTVIQTSSELYLIVGYSLVSILNFLEFLFVGHKCITYSNCEP